MHPPVHGVSVPTVCCQRDDHHTSQQNLMQQFRSCRASGMALWHSTANEAEDAGLILAAAAIFLLEVKVENRPCVNCSHALKVSGWSLDLHEMNFLDLNYVHSTQKLPLNCTVALSAATSFWLA